MKHPFLKKCPGVEHRPMEWLTVYRGPLNPFPLVQVLPATGISHSSLIIRLLTLSLAYLSINGLCEAAIHFPSSLVGLRLQAKWKQFIPFRLALRKALPVNMPCYLSRTQCLFSGKTNDIVKFVPNSSFSFIINLRNTYVKRNSNVPTGIHMVS